MLASFVREIFPAKNAVPPCNCGAETRVVMHGYGYGKDGRIFVCEECALQLVRKITEDLCELLTRGGRHG